MIKLKMKDTIGGKMTTEIVKNIMEINREIDKKREELSKLSAKLYEYKNQLRKLHPNELVDVVEFETKQKIYREEKR